METSIGTTAATTCIDGIIVDGRWYYIHTGRLMYLSSGGLIEV